MEGWICCASKILAAIHMRKFETFWNAGRNFETRLCSPPNPRRSDLGKHERRQISSGENRTLVNAKLPSAPPALRAGTSSHWAEGVFVKKFGLGNWKQGFCLIYIMVNSKLVQWSPLRWSQERSPPSNFFVYKYFLLGPFVCEPHGSKLSFLLQFMFLELQLMEM